MGSLKHTHKPNNQRRIFFVAILYAILKLNVNPKMLLYKGRHQKRSDVAV